VSITVAAPPNTPSFGGFRSAAGLGRSILRTGEGRVGGAILVIAVVTATFPDLLAGPYQTASLATGGFLQPPSPHHLLGTDEVGRDVLNLAVHGARVSLAIGTLATTIAVLLGTLIGLVAGYAGGWLDSWLMRLTDFFFVVPPFVLALAITPIALEAVGQSGEILGFRASLFIIVLVIGLTSWPFITRVVRSQTLSLRNRPFVDRARVAGTGPIAIMARHILPNVIPQIVANGALVIAGAIATETALAFIGLGDPLQPSWGTLLFLAQRAGAASAGAWWYVGSPGICVVVVILAFILIGEALDTTLNPRRRVIP
jgi:peptide/nickel transport system permease protein